MRFSHPARFTFWHIILFQISDSASVKEDTPIVFMDSLFMAASMLELGMMQVVKPILSASLTLFKAELIPLISPASPISPISRVPSGITLLFMLEYMAQATPKSTAGSLIFMPPATLT